MAKLHELLAAEPNIAGQHNVIADETLKVLGHPDAFLRIVKTESYFAEDDKKLDKIETKTNTTTVMDRLSYSLGRSFVAYVDYLAQKDATNQQARADVMVNGDVILRDVPATTLLTLENKLPEKRKEIEAAPTLQSGPVWEWDANESMWKTTQPEVAYRFKKIVKPVVLHPGTVEHAPQVIQVGEDIPIAKIEKTVWSGMWTSRQKMDALARIDALLVAVKKARQRANRTDVVSKKIGQTISEFILRGPEADALNGHDSPEN